MRGIIPGTVCLLMLASTARAEPPPSDAAKAAETAVRNALNGAGASIDACVERHIAEYPTADGKATLDLTVQKTGMVEKCVVTVALEGARNLKVCLEKAGRSVKFPQPGEGGATLKVTAVIKKGAKFRIPAPDEKPPEGEPPPQDEGFVDFFPANWVPQQ